MASNWKGSKRSRRFGKDSSSSVSVASSNAGDFSIRGGGVDERSRVGSAVQASSVRNGTSDVGRRVGRRGYGIEKKMEESTAGRSAVDHHYRSTTTGRLCDKLCVVGGLMERKWREMRGTEFVQRQKGVFQILKWAWFAFLVTTIAIIVRFSNQIGADIAIQTDNSPRSKKAFMNGLRRPAITSTKASHLGKAIPTVYDTFADLSTPLHTTTDLALFWHIPRAAGSTVTDIMAQCMKLVLASDVGGRNNHNKDPRLQVLPFGHSSYVNVDTTTPEGIQRAIRLGLASSNLADVIVTSRIYDAAPIFTSNNNARLFAVFRHPIERAVSLFHHTQDNIWIPNNTPELKDMSILEYFQNGLGENNWMTRFLTNVRASLTESDLETAMEILRRKCLVGLFHKKAESIRRIQTYFHFETKDGKEGLECLDKKLNWAWPRKHKHEEVEEGTQVWDAIAKMNRYDLKLYEYAEQLFREQAELFQ